MELIIQNLSKTYPNGTQALDSVCLRVSSGLFGLLGPNGAGKSTLMRIISTLQEPDNGSISFEGIDVLKDKNSIKKMLGYLPQEFGLYPKISAEILLDYLAALKGIIDRKKRHEVVKQLLMLTNLYEFRTKALGTFSGGMKQRFGIAQALIGNPQLIIVDEPTAGLDPEERVRFHNILAEIGEKTVVILSTHIVSDVSELCSTMAIINNGKILLKGNPAHYVRMLSHKIWKRFIDNNDLDRFFKEYKIISSKLISGKRLIHIYSEIDPQNGFEPAIPDLEDVYFTVIKSYSNFKAQS